MIGPTQTQTLVKLEISSFYSFDLWKCSILDFYQYGMQSKLLYAANFIWAPPHLSIQQQVCDEKIISCPKHFYDLWHDFIRGNTDPVCGLILNLAS